MIKKIACLLTILIFIGPVALHVLNWPVEGMKNLHLYPSFYMLVVFLIIAVFRKQYLPTKCVWGLLIVGLVFSFDLIFKVLDRNLPRMVLANSMTLPVLYYFFYNSKLLQNTSIRVSVKRVIIFMYLMNNIIAIFERMTVHLFLPLDYINSDYSMMSVTDIHVFRSTALLGHPLSNAIIMSIVMVFILTSDMKEKRKYTLYYIGFFGLFCFNARAAILLTGLTLILYFVGILLSKRSKIEQKKLIVIIAIFSILFISYIFIGGYGGRLQEHGDLANDDSALTRLEVFRFLTEMNITDFLWGLKAKEVEALALLLLGSTHIENWFILSSLQVGLVLTTIVVLLYIPVVRYAIRNYRRSIAVLLLIITVGLPSTNNSLACGVPALPVFFACCYAFDGKMLKRYS